MDGAAEKSWRTLSSKTVFEDNFIRLRVDHAVSPGGVDTQYSVVSFQRYAVGVVPLAADGTVWLVGQHRYPLDRFSWEIPEGGAPHDADHLEHCKIELREETGLAADNWRRLLTLHTSNSSTDEEATVWLATGLRHVGAPQPEHSEMDMQQRRVPLLHALDMIASGEITDAISVAGLLQTWRLAVKGDLEPELAQAALSGAQ